jgi:multidrug efflux pump subunit AcrA (membrane-fusion protein)
MRERSTSGSKPIQHTECIAATASKAVVCIVILTMLAFIALFRVADSVGALRALSLYFQNPARAARIIALSIAIWFIPPLGIASEVPEQEFDGVVVPRQWVQVVPQVNGVVSRILFVPGQRVSKGDVLFEMDAEDFAIDVRIAQSELDEARARLSLAEDAAERQGRLLRQDATPQQLARQSEIEVEIARANVAH